MKSETQTPIRIPPNEELTMRLLDLRRMEIRDYRRRRLLAAQDRSHAFPPSWFHDVRNYIAMDKPLPAYLGPVPEEAWDLARDLSTANGERP